MDREIRRSERHLQVPDADPQPHQGECRRRVCRIGGDLLPQHLLGAAKRHVRLQFVGGGEDELRSRRKRVSDDVHVDPVSHLASLGVEQQDALGGRHDQARIDDLHAAAEFDGVRLVRRGLVWIGRLPWEDPRREAERLVAEGADPTADPVDHGAGPKQVSRGVPCVARGRSRRIDVVTRLPVEHDHLAVIRPQREHATGRDDRAADLPGATIRQVRTQRRVVPSQPAGLPGQRVEPCDGADRGGDHQVALVQDGRGERPCEPAADAARRRDVPHPPEATVIETQRNQVAAREKLPAHLAGKHVHHPVADDRSAVREQAVQLVGSGQPVDMALPPKPARVGIEADDRSLGSAGVGEGVPGNGHDRPFAHRDDVQVTDLPVALRDGG